MSDAKRVLEVKDVADLPKEYNRLYLEFSPRRNSFEFFLFGEERHGEHEFVEFVARPLTAVEKTKENFAVDPFLSISKKQAQGLLDGLYQSGLRPTHTVEAMSSMTAMSDHLQDMRKLVQKKYAVNLVD